MTEHTSTIMVIEDEALLLQAIVRKIELSDMNVIACPSGKDALESLATLQTVPDAIWLDYYLKDTDGLQLMQQIKNNPAWEHIPVLVVSNSASNEKVHNMLALGVKKYIIKAEYRLEEIIGIIRELIDERR